MRAIKKPAGACASRFKRYWYGVKLSRRQKAVKPGERNAAPAVSFPTWCQTSLIERFGRGSLLYPAGQQAGKGEEGRPAMPAAGPSDLTVSDSLPT